MKFSIKNILVWFLLCSVYGILVSQGLLKYEWVVPAVVTAYAAANIGFFRMLVRSHERHPKRFVASFTGVIGIKLFGTMAFLLAYLFLHRENFLPVVVALALSYLVFTAVLVSSALKAFK
ncbi:MAG: hypothetical protein NWR73_03335 [Flavobacteriales bacterium]|jgi:uncharacterized membrane protein|nr:hypothetical protein [Flavobacteriales bacterium]